MRASAWTTSTSAMASKVVMLRSYKPTFELLVALLRFVYLYTRWLAFWIFDIGAIDENGCWLPITHRDEFIYGSSPCIAWLIEILGFFPFPPNAPKVMNMFEIRNTRFFLLIIF
jgi:hypothetical protein